MESKAVFVGILVLILFGLMFGCIDKTTTSSGCIFIPKDGVECHRLGSTSVTVWGSVILKDCNDGLEYTQKDYSQKCKGV